MRRRPVDFRRPVRRRVSNVVVWSLCGIVVLLFIVIFSKESRIESRPTSSIKVKICALQDFSVVCSIAWFLMCLIAVKCGNFEGNQCFEF
jgi:ACR3 family arsenite efflux pump ArsB